MQNHKTTKADSHHQEPLSKHTPIPQHPSKDVSEKEGQRESAQRLSPLEEERASKTKHLYCEPDQNAVTEKENQKLTVIPVTENFWVI